MTNNARIIPSGSFAIVLVIALIISGCSTAMKPGEHMPTNKENLHLYLLLGQSNMAGRGEVGEQDRQSHPRVLTLSKENKWVVAVDPIHFDKDIAGVGPGLTFGKVLADKKPDITIGLIPCAAGGSSIIHWKAGAWFEQTKSHPYDEAIKRAKIALKNGVLKGILWHQGEGDSIEESAPAYEQNLMGLIDKIRRDLDSPELPFVVGEMGDLWMDEHPFARVVNDMLKRIPDSVEHTACVSAQGLTVKDDRVHFDTKSAREMGRRFAGAMMELESASGAQ